jgi:iron-sulfur cluster assembly protein
MDTTTDTRTSDAPLANAAAAPATPTAKKKPSVEVTAAAIAAIEKMQQKRVAEGKERAIALRIGIRGGGCTGFGYLFEWCDETPRPTDRIFEFNDGQVKVVSDPKSLLYLDGLTLDYITGMMGHGFKFVNPNVKSTCGCGESVQF